MQNSDNNNVTFVTSYFKIYDEDYTFSKTFENRLPHFLKVADTGINICVFITPEFEESFKNITDKYANVKVCGIYSKTQLPFSATYFPEINSLSLPEIRNPSKDTEYYMCLMNSKIDFVKKAIDLNPFSTNYFSWFDFSMAYLFKNMDASIEQFKSLSSHNYVSSFLIMPGCWGKVNDINYIKNYVCWRFCGSFFMGDKDSLIDFYNVSISSFSEFLTQTNTLSWEVNYWAWLETHKNFNPIWYSADHTESMLNIPENVYKK